MRKQHVTRTSREGDNSRFGFTTAANVMSGSPSNLATDENTNNKCSSTWRAFFQRLNQEENMPLPFKNAAERTVVVPPHEIRNQSVDLHQSPKSANQELCSPSLIFNRLMNTDGFSNILDETNNTSVESSSVLQHRQSEPTEEEFYSVFTKRGMKPRVSSATSAEKSPIIYSPPKFFASTSCAMPVGSRNSAENNILVAPGTKPYASSSAAVPPKKRQLIVPLASSPVRTTNLTGAWNLPSHLTDRPIMMFSVLYSVSSTRKHKKWENDGYLYFDFAENQLCLLKALDKSPIARHPTPRISSEQVAMEYVAGHQTFIGGYEVQIQDEFFTNLHSDIKEEKYDAEEENVNAIKKARVEDDKHFFDEQMENFLVKTENDENEPVAFGLFDDKQSSKNHPQPAEREEPAERESIANYASFGVKEEIQDDDEEKITNCEEQKRNNGDTCEIGFPGKQIKLEEDR